MIDATHQWERDQFIRLCKEEEVDRVDDRLAVFDRFLGIDDHVSAAELTDALAAEGKRFDPNFVLDTLHFCCHLGLAWPNRFKNRELKFEHRHLGQHHDHMICTQCGAILEFQNAFIEHLQEEIADAHGFQMLDHRMEIYGLCRNCHGNRGGLIPLSEARQGERLRIRQLDGGAKIRGRLISMGMRQDDIVEVITSPGRGQLVVAVDGKRFVIGRGMAEKIRVEPVLPGDQSADGNPDLPDQSVPLSQLKEGADARLIRVGGSPALRRRILEMGLTKGTPVHIEKYAPLRDPLELVVKGAHISLRVEEAAQILVDPLGSDKE